MIRSTLLIEDNNVNHISINDQAQMSNFSVCSEVSCKDKVNEVGCFFTPRIVYGNVRSIDSQFLGFNSNLCCSSTSNRPTPSTSAASFVSLSSEHDDDMNMAVPLSMNPSHVKSKEEAFRKDWCKGGLRYETKPSHRRNLFTTDAEDKVLRPYRDTTQTLFVPSSRGFVSVDALNKLSCGASNTSFMNYEELDSNCQPMDDSHSRLNFEEMEKTPLGPAGCLVSFVCAPVRAAVPKTRVVASSVSTDKKEPSKDVTSSSAKLSLPPRAPKTKSSASSFTSNGVECSLNAPVPSCATVNRATMKSEISTTKPPTATKPLPQKETPHACPPPTCRPSLPPRQPLLPSRPQRPLPPSAASSSKQSNVKPSSVVRPALFEGVVESYKGLKYAPSSRVGIADSLRSAPKREMNSEVASFYVKSLVVNIPTSDSQLVVRKVGSIVKQGALKA